jgi:hypothetical protein
VVDVAQFNAGFLRLAKGRRNGLSPVMRENIALYANYFPQFLDRNF